MISCEFGHVTWKNFSHLQPHRASGCFTGCFEIQTKDAMCLYSKPTSIVWGSRDRPKMPSFGKAWGPTTPFPQSLFQMLYLKRCDSSFIGKQVWNDWDVKLDLNKLEYIGMLMSTTLKPCSKFRDHESTKPKLCWQLWWQLAVCLSCWLCTKARPAPRRAKSILVTTGLTGPTSSHLSPRPLVHQKH